MFQVIGFHDYKLPTEIDEKGHSDRSIDNKIKRQKAIQQRLGCKFFRMDPNKEGFDIFKTVNKIFRRILNSKKSTKKSLIKKISMRLLEFEFKSDNLIKSKTTKFIVKKILPHYK